LLLLGFDGAFPRSELVSLGVNDLEFAEAGSIDVTDAGWLMRPNADCSGAALHWLRGAYHTRLAGGEERTVSMIVLASAGRYPEEVAERVQFMRRKRLANLSRGNI